jgi:mono/diheme cytochrome c family protein
MKHFQMTLATVALAIAASRSMAAGDPRAFLAKHCAECHGTAKAKGDFHIDRLNLNFADTSNRERWVSVLNRIESGEMPPKEKPRLPAKESRAAIEWIRDQVTATEKNRQTQGRAVLRRLNRVEYDNTIRDLLGVNIELRELLPQDSSAHGFDNVGSALHVSSFLMERYLEAADKALSVTIANGPRPPLFKKRLDLRVERHVKVTTERVFRHLDDGLVFFSSSLWQGVTVSQFYPPDRGRYRFRISAQAYQSGGKPVTFRVDAGPMLMATKNHLVNYFDAPADKAAVFEFIEDQEARSTIRILPHGLASAQAVHKVGADKYDGPGLLIHWVEVEGPLHDQWPPACHQRIFGDMPQKPVKAPNQYNRVEVVSATPEADAERILRGFVRRAYRRAVTDDDVKPYLNLFAKKLGENRTFEQAIRACLLGVMVSPEFLYLRERPGRLDDYALASRLSYFLWSTMPDEELLTLAEKGRLGNDATLRAQVQRMLKHPNSSAFVENFVGQWLGLRDIDFTEPSHILYPDYDAMLRASMVRESEMFFAEILKDDLNLTNFISSDFAMLNGRLAKHYGIPGVDGWEFRKVALPPGSHRGGVLTMASVLKVTANGTTTSPVVRGAWVLDRILGTPPPRPPADVPAVEPDIRGATTIRQQLAKHRQLESCASCHVKIDPPGFALESFDVIGGYREYYRTSGNGKPVVIDGRRMPYLRGPAIDPSDVMPDGTRFRNIDEFKQILLRDKDAVARALTEKLATYACGAPVSPGERSEIDAIVVAARGKTYGLRSLIEEIVLSRLFRIK